MVIITLVRKRPSLPKLTEERLVGIGEVRRWFLGVEILAEDGELTGSEVFVAMVEDALEQSFKGGDAIAQLLEAVLSKDKNVLQLAGVIDLLYGWRLVESFGSFGLGSLRGSGGILFFGSSFRHVA